MKTLTYDDRVATYKDTDVNIGFNDFSFSLPDGKIGISVSSGLDSAAIIDLICRYITDLKLENKIKIKPIHSVCREQWNSLYIAQTIVDDIYIKYPNIDIDDMEVFYYSEKDPKIVKQITAWKIFFDRLYNENLDLKTIILGLTALPSKEIIDLWGVSYYPKNRVFSERKSQHLQFTEISHIYQPLINNNKLIIASLYKYLNIPNSYITDLTFSCSFYHTATKNFTEPCKTCYHCHERQWAFGSF